MRYTILTVILALSGCYATKIQPVCEGVEAGSLCFSDQEIEALARANACYDAIDEQLPYETAQDQCIAIGAHLAGFTYDATNRTSDDDVLMLEAKLDALFVLPVADAAAVREAVSDECLHVSDDSALCDQLPLLP